MSIDDILFIIEGNSSKKCKVIEKRLKEFSVEVKVEIFNSDKEQNYSKIIITHQDSKFICLLNEEMRIQDNFIELFKEYQEDETSIYLPLIILESPKNKGVLNNCLWNPNLSIDVGFLNHDLALKQIDTTLYGSFIPTNVFLNHEYYKKELEYYQHFYFLNKYTSREKNTVIGIPKILFTTSIDLSFEGVDNDIKVKNFRLAAKEFENKN